LDEVNCVSETLAPAMLQFLQYKVFGRHRIPDGWIIVAAGNPPEYNNSVREFDIVTWDRLKRIDIEPDFDAWKEYAYKSDVHASVITYLDIKKADFYSIETTVDGKTFVTARGWSDLSDMIKLYEKNGIAVKESLVSQYLQNKKIAKNFAIYYDLFNKYKSDYQIDSILAGDADSSIKDRAKNAKFDERYSLLGLILDKTTADMHEIYIETECLTELMKFTKTAILKTAGDDLDSLIKEEIKKYEELIRIGKDSSNLSYDDEVKYRLTVQKLEQISSAAAEKNPSSKQEVTELLKDKFNSEKDLLSKKAKVTGSKLTNAFLFCEEVFGEGQEVLILVTELTINPYSASFISRYGCDEYFKHNKELLFYERQQEILTKLDDLKIE
jgi:hypothetical protein